MSYVNLEEASDDLVPNYGHAGCIAGEIVRAYNNLCYAFYNNGDKAGCENGGNTRTEIAAYILETYVEDKLFQEKFEKLCNTERDDDYERTLESLEPMILGYINNNKDLYNYMDFAE